MPGRALAPLRVAQGRYLAEALQDTHRSTPRRSNGPGARIRGTAYNARPGGARLLVRSNIEDVNRTAVATCRPSSDFLALRRVRTSDWITSQSADPRTPGPRLPPAPADRSRRLI